MRTLMAMVVICSLAAFSACHQDEFCDGRCWDDGYYSHGCDCWCPDPDPYPDDSWPPPDEYGWCSNSEECAEGQVCAPFGQCLDLVLDCPLTEECLPDPEGYVSDWMGIDPTYVGEFPVNDTRVRLIVDLDFYQDHLYGEGFAEIWSEWGYWEGYNFAVTGSRNGDQLWGQVIDADGFGRSFDLVFEAHLLSASEIAGSFRLSGNEGDVQGEFALYRTSPCGCDGEPQPDPPGNCVEHADCPDGQVCVDHQCVPACQSDCCVDSDCSEGDACVEGACLTPCESTCQCDAGEICDNGYCVPCEDPPAECQTDCDCDFAAGYRCIDGICQIP